MENTRKKVSITPPEGEAVARYTVKVRPVDVFWRRIYQRLAPTMIKSALKLVLLWWIIGLVMTFNEAVLKAALGISERLEDYVSPVVEGYFSVVWIFTAVFWIYFAYLVLRLAQTIIGARTSAENTAAATMNEEYAFFESGMIFSNGKDLIRINKKKILFIFATHLGLIIHAPGVAETMIIPVRYFCTEYPKLEETLKKYAPGRFWQFKKLGREHDPMYENPLEKITIPAPMGDKIAEINVKLRFSDLWYIYSLYRRQIAHRYHRGLFFTLLLMLSAVAMFVAGIILQEAALWPFAFVLLGAAIAYVIIISLSSYFKGRKLLVNRGDYRKPVKYIFYPAGFLLVYENGISHVMYEDLELIFEDDEGMAFFFSKKQCLFLPAYYTRTVDGRRLSHFFKASLFNLDPERGKNNRVDEQLVAFEREEEKAHERRMRQLEKRAKREQKKRDEGGSFDI